MNEVIRFFDDLPLIVKVIFALPVLDILWAVYRLCRSIEHKNTAGIILAVLMLLFCPTLFWIVDIVTLLVMEKVIWLD